MGQKQQLAAADPKKRRRVGFPCIDSGVEASDCIQIYLVSSKEEVGDSSGFLIEPVDLNAFFGEDGKIYGYQGLKITIWVSSVSFHAFADIAFDSTSDGGKGITDLNAALKDTFALTLVESKDELLQTFSTQTNFIRSMVSGGEILQHKASNGSMGSDLEVSMGPKKEKTTRGGAITETARGNKRPRLQQLEMPQPLEVEAEVEDGNETEDFMNKNALNRHREMQGRSFAMERGFGLNTSESFAMKGEECISLEGILPRFKWLATYANAKMLNTNNVLVVQIQNDKGTDQKSFPIDFADMYDMISFKEIGATWISIYMSWLKMNKNVDDRNLKIGFIEPFAFITTENLRAQAKELYNALAKCETDRTMLLPYNGCNNHWILVVIAPYKDLVIIFNPLKGGNIFPELKYAINIALQDFKLAHKNVRMNEGSSTVFYNVRDSPKQPENFECGYYVMRHMRDIIVHSISWLLKKKDSYSQAEIDEVRFEAMQYVEEVVDFNL